MDKYLLLCRIKYEDGVIEPVYKWFSGADKMENYIRNVGKICRAKVFIDYAAEVIEDRIIIKREFKRDIVLCERSKELYHITMIINQSIRGTTRDCLQNMGLI